MLATEDDRQQATVKVWEDYQMALKGFLHARVSNPADVDDLLQEILIRTFRHLPRLQSRDKLRAWLFQVARNATVDFYRRKGRPPPQADELWYEDGVNERHGLEDCMEVFLSALPPASAELLRAIDLEGLSQKKYAAQRAVSYSTLKSRVQRARGELKSVIDDCCNLVLDRRGRVIEYHPKPGGCKKS